MSSTNDKNFHDRSGTELFVDIGYVRPEGESGNLLFRFAGAPIKMRWIVVKRTAMVSRLYTVLGAHWKLPRPELLISVVGGAHWLSQDSS